MIVKIVKLILKKKRKKKFIRILLTRENAELTVETAIVFTIILFLICSMVYCSLYLHDKVAIKAYAYAGMVEGASLEEGECQKTLYKKINKTPVFVIRPSASISGDFNKYRCKISEKEHSTMGVVSRFFTKTMGSQEVEVVRKMPIDKMYLYKAIKDGIKK